MTPAPQTTVWLEGVFPLLLPPFLRGVYASRILDRPADFPFLPPMSPGPARAGDETPPEDTSKPTEQPIIFPDLTIQPNVKEGGLFLRSANPALHRVMLHLTPEASGRRLWSSLFPMRAYLVKGKPWLEDMKARKPSSYLKVQFQGGGPDVSMEMLYEEFRPFGRISNIMPQSTADKELPRYAVVQYSSRQAATSARICVHGELVGETRLSVLYEPHPLFGTVRSWIAANTRIAILFLLGLLAGLSYIVFDPIRIFSIKTNLYGVHLDRSVLSRLSSFFGRAEPAVMAELFERPEDIQQLTSLLLQRPESLILVLGGQKELADRALENVRYSLTIDCGALAGQPDAVMLSRLATQLGYFPSFSTFTSFSAMLDTLITATTGVKAALGTNLEAELYKMLDALSVAVSEMIAEQEAARNAALARQARAKDPATVHVPEVQYPTIVLNNYMELEQSTNGSGASSTLLYDVLAQWAALTAEYHVANLLFLSTNPGAAKKLESVYARQPLELLTIAEVSKAHVLEYVSKRLNLPMISSELDVVLDKLGGRPGDLELLITKMRSGLSPRDALEDIILRTVGELRKLALQPEKPQSFSPVQFWAVVEALAPRPAPRDKATKDAKGPDTTNTITATNPDVSYDALRNSPLFRGDDTPLVQMERAGLLAFVHERGRPYLVTTFRPIHRVAFQYMLEDVPFTTTMRLLTLKALSAREQTKLAAYESELTLLLDMLSKGYHLLGGERYQRLEDRVSFLTRELADAARKLERWRVEEKAHKRTLANALPA